MKHKLSYLLIAAIVIAFLGSCKKTYICKCDGGFTGSGMETTLEKSSKKNAENTCKTYDMGNNTPDGFYNCRLE